MKPDEITFTGYRDALCQKNCVFLETGYELFIDKLIGQSVFFPEKTKKYNYGMLKYLGISLTPRVTSSIDCN